MPPSDNFNWLHLTDLHHGQSGQRPYWPNVREALFKDLRKIHDVCGPWNAVFFTGDFVQAGLEEEFKDMEAEVLARVWEELETLGSGDAVLLSVPGNHDLVRPSAYKPAAAFRQLLRPNGFVEIADEFWSDHESEYRQICSTAFVNYNSWWRRTRFRSGDIQEGLLPGDFATTLTLGERKIGIIGLNSTFLQLASGDYQGRLTCDVRQLQAVCGDASDWLASHEVCLLLTHQGPDWLEKSAKLSYPEINPAGRFAAHLFGHMHETDYLTTIAGGGEPLRHWQSLSLFGLDKFGEPPVLERRHGYTAGRLSFGTKTATIRFWPRRAVRDPGGWRFNRDDTSCQLEDDGGTRAQPVASFPKFRSSGRKAASRATVSAAASPSVETIRREIADQMAKDVLQAVVGWRVPDELFFEAKKILESRILRKNCEYVITFVAPYPAMPDGYFVIRRDLSFTVTNLLQETTTFEARSSYSGDVDLTSEAWQGRHYHLNLAVDGQKIQIQPNRNLFVKEGITILSEPVRLAPGGSARISLLGEEPCRIEAGRNTYIQGTPVIGVSVKIVNGYPEVISAAGVQMNHPEAAKMKVESQGRYVLDRPFLPGQGFQIYWQKR